MNLNPYESLGKKILFVSWGVMAFAFLLGAQPPMWNLVLNIGLGGYLLYKNKL